MYVLYFLMSDENIKKIKTRKIIKVIELVCQRNI